MKAPSSPEESTAQGGREKAQRQGVVVPRPLVWAWALIWPVIGFAFSAVGTELAARITPGVVDSASDKAGIGPIQLRSSWPGDPCEQGAQAAASVTSQPAVGKVLENYDPLAAAFDAGAYAYGGGQLRVVVSAQPTVTVIVESIEVVTFLTEDLPIAWAIGQNPQCGGGSVDVRQYDLQIDAPEPRLRLVSADDHLAPPGAGFTAFEASATDPTIVVVQVAACSTTRSWGLKIGYSVNGGQFEAWVGSPEAPLRISGRSLTQDSVAYYYDSTSSEYQRIPSTAFPAREC